MSKTLLTTTLFIFNFAMAAFGQGVIGFLEYIKAEDPEEFLKIEEEWHPIYKNLIKQKEMDGCAAYQVMYKTREDDYNYIKILWFDAFSKISFRPNHDNFLEAYPNKDESDWKDLQKRTKEAYKVIKSGYFQMQASCANGLDKEGSFYRINELNIQPGKSKEYLSLMKDIYLPIYKEAVKDQHRTAWSLWAKWTGTTDNFEYNTADGYGSMDQIDQDRFNEIFRELFPDKNIDEISDQMKDLSTLVNSEMWKMVYRILP